MPRRIGQLISTIVLSVLIAGAVNGQQDDDFAPGPADPAAQAGSFEVYLNDSFEAADALSRVEALTRAERWSEAASLLQEAAERFTGKLMRVTPRHFVDLREHIQGKIAAWPPAGVAAYRDLYEPALKAALDEGTTRRNVAELLNLFERYFCTTGAAELADTIGQLAIEAGDLSLADYVYARVLAHHPDATRFGPRYRAMRAVVAAMRGDKSVALDDLAPLPPRLHWMGQERPPEEVISDIRLGFEALRTKPPPTEWPLVGGDALRNRPTTCAVDELGLLWRQPYDAASIIRIESGPSELSGLSDRDRARELTVQPVVSGGLVYVQRLREIIALELTTGEVAWHFRPDESAAPGVQYIDERPTGWDAVTVHEGAVYATLAGEGSAYYSYDAGRSPQEIVCLDARTGRQRWRVNQRMFGERFAEVHFDTSPLVSEGRVYVIGRRRRSFGFEDSYLFRFRAIDGTLEARTHLGSASTGNFGSPPMTKAMAAMDGDTVYVCTNLGTIAAVGARTGAVRWLRLYDRLRSDVRHGTGRHSLDVNPWHFNPTIIDNERLVALPTDGASVLVLSTRDGRLLHDIPTTTFGDVETLLGIRDDVLCGTGREVGCMDLSKEETIWSHPIAAAGGLFGRGMWVDDRLLIPTRGHLAAYNRDDGSLTELPWGGEAEGGNLLALPEFLIVAGAEAVSVYVRKSEIWNNLRGRMAAAPDNPLPALELAEVALRGGERKEALSALSEAARRAGLTSENLDPAVHQRLYRDVLVFADAFSRRGELTPDLLDTLHDYASRYAPDATAHLEYRVRLATLFDAQDRPDRALVLYQQILRDRSLREMTVEPALLRGATSREQRRRDGDFSDRRTVTPLPVAAEVTDRIAELMRRHGPSIYAPFEAEAERLLESAKLTNDTSALERIVTTFPNSAAAPKTLEWHGDLLVRTGRPLDALARYVPVLHRYAGMDDRPALLRKIADAYEKGERPLLAWHWLTKATREFPTARFEHDGRTWTFAEYRERLAWVREQVEPARASLTPPLNKSFERTLEAGAKLLAPWFSEDPRADWSRAFVWSSDSITAYDPESGEPLWPEPAEVRGAATLLLAMSDAVFVATSYEIVALNPSTGQRIWTDGSFPAQLDDPGADWETADAMRGHALAGSYLVSVRDSGNMTCLDITSGARLWRETHPTVPRGQFRAVDPWIVYPAVQDGRVVLHLVELASGVSGGTIVTEEARSAEDVFVSLDGQVVLVTPQSISSYDPQSRQRRWRVPFPAPMRITGLVLDVDALFLSPDGRRIQKYSLDDGRVLWSTDEFALHGEELLSVHREGGYLLIASSSAVNALDLANGLLLWRGTTSERPHLSAAMVAQSFAIALDIAGSFRGEGAVAYFYDHRHASGLIPRGGVVKLGPLEDLRTAIALDGALVIQAGTTLRGYAQE